ncbi:hypothetical protein EMGR_001143 [Emarellia grisea]
MMGRARSVGARPRGEQRVARARATKGGRGGRGGRGGGGGGGAQASARRPVGWPSWRGGGRRAGGRQGDQLAGAPWAGRPPAGKGARHGQTLAERHTRRHRG